MKKSKFRDLLHNEDGSAAVLMQIFFAVILIVAIVVAFQLAPVVGYQVENSNSIPSSSQWNATTNTNIVTGSSLWGTQGGMLKATITIGVSAIALVALFGIFAARRGGGGQGGGL